LPEPRRTVIQRAVRRAKTLYGEDRTGLALAQLCEIWLDDHGD
jgi:hypothetical protein